MGTAVGLSVQKAGQCPGQAIAKAPVQLTVLQPGASGTPLHEAVGAAVGDLVGAEVGAIEGTAVGTAVGD